MSDTPRTPRSSSTPTDETNWLGIDPGRPAFEIRRAFYGGDFARGGSGGEPKNALRFPTVLPSEADLLKGEVMFNALPLDYESIQLQWGYPPQYLDDEGNIRQELLSRVLIARSSYGHPVAPQEGCIVYDQTLRANSSTPSVAPGYLTPTVGTVTTPDPGPLPSTFTLVAHVDAEGTGNQVIVGQAEVEGVVSWYLRRYNDDTDLNVYTTPDGSFGTAVGLWGSVVPPPLTGERFLAVAMSLTAGTLTAYTSPDGAVWTISGSGAVGVPMPAFDSATVMRVGDYGYGDPWQGRIYSVELRTGLNPAGGTVLWRFDADDYPGGNVLTYTDLRGRPWTLTNATAITPARYQGAKGTIVDQVLQQGRWYCYSLFFQTPTFRWLRVATAETLLPYDYHHRDFLWDRIPPFYQAVDRQYIPETQVGVLQRFLQVIGYELDYVRTLAEGAQEIYSADFVPPALNAAFVTQNLGLHWEGALGECNMRAFGANYSELTQQRGTQNGLSDLIHSTTKCDAVIRSGANRMLNPNDSEFVDHTGNWTLPLTAPFPLPGNAATQTSTVVPLRTLPATGGLPGGRGALRISGTASPVALNCGWGTDIKGTAAGGNLVPPRVLTPIYYGIPAAENETYGYLFSLYGIAVTGISYGFTWVEADGLTVISHIAASANLLLNTWTTFKMSATAPSGTKYVIPYLSIPALGPFYLAAVMVSEFVGAGSLGAFLPDIYLTMGDATETIGSDNAYLGEPK